MIEKLFLWFLFPAMLSFFTYIVITDMWKIEFVDKTKALAISFVAWLVVVNALHEWVDSL